MIKIQCTVDKNTMYSKDPIHCLGVFIIIIIIIYIKKIISELSH